MPDKKTEAPPAPRLLYEDDWLVVVDKPPGVPVHPSPRWKSGTVIEWLWEHFEGPRSRVQLAHRLDRETTGVLVATKDPETNDRMHNRFRAQEVDKTYVALVVGAPDWERTRVHAPIGPHPASAVHIAMAVAQDGQASLTEFEVLERLSGHALVQARPRTGRTHQIRVHLAHLGHPVVGDKIYGSDEQLFLRWVDGRMGAADWAQLGMRRHALHAERVVFRHPWRSGDIEILAPVPKDMTNHLQGLRERVDLKMDPS